MPVPTARATAPPPHITRRLANGLLLRVESQPWLSSAAICVRVNAGSHDEPRAYPGLAHFIEHLLFLDCAEFTGEQRLLPFVQACAGQVNATTQARHSEYFCQVPAQQLGAALQRLTAMLAQPLFNTLEQQREREVLHAEFLARGQDAETLLLTALGQALPSAHRGADFVAGNRHSLPIEQAEFQQALRAFHQRGYHAGQCQLSLIGPQPLPELLQLAEQQGARLPPDGGRAEPEPVPESASPLLPLRFNQARISLPGSQHGVHLAWALELDAAQAPAALSWLQQSLLAPGGGLSQLPGQGAQLRSLYSCHDQHLWLLSLPHAVDSPQVQAQLRSWARFMAGQQLAELLAAQQQAQVYQLASLAPLALARRAALQLSGAAQPCSLATLQRVLTQLQCAERQVCLHQGSAVSAWPGAVFPLRLQVEPQAPLPVLALTWPAPPGNPLLAELAQMRLPCRAQLSWLPAPAQEQSRPLKQAIWHGRWQFAQNLEAAPLKQLAVSCAAALMQQAEPLGVSVQLSAEPGSLLLRVQGAEPLLPRVLAGLWQAWQTPHAQHWQALHMPPESSSMALRHLLNHSEQLVGTAAGVALAARDWPQLCASLQVQGLGVGFSRAGQAALSQLFEPAPVVQPKPAAPQRSGVHWRYLAAHGEAAVLLFCPQPSAAASTEAAWRLLAQLQQNAFYQRLRSELQVGYALFCQYRQIGAQRGLLFAVQSPKLNSGEIVAQIQLFLQQRRDWLAQLPAAELDAARSALSQQLCAQEQSLEGRAEQHWQAQLAGLTPAHASAVQQHILSLAPSTLLAAQDSLSQARAGWSVLSNQAEPT